MNETPVDEAARLVRVWKVDADSDPEKWVCPTQPPPRNLSGQSKPLAMESYVRQAAEVVQRLVTENKRLRAVAVAAQALLAALDAGGCYVDGDYDAVDAEEVAEIRLRTSLGLLEGTPQ